ncbi:MAG TPA: macro domain-containing protein [Candidatus Binataceae bacterium]|jgi:O-acetyl-ADP-ribose deacetylase (regulator of RNase III)|nr:macro domain-containing protein [Candidatus Binataceae bacterium]
MRIVTRQGDLTESDCEAVVNAANTDLMLGAGVAGAIRTRGGPRIQAECDQIGPIELGEAAVTTGGNLKARYVIHAAGMHLGGRASERSLRDASRNSLRRATEKGIKSIAFPAIGTGIAGFPIKRCAEVMLEEIRDYLKREHLPERVEMVLFDQAALSAFEQALKDMKD